MGLLTGMVTASNHTKCMLLSNKKCMAQSTLINLDPNKYSHYYPFMVKLDRCVGRCNNDLINCLIKYVFQIKQKT